MTDAAREQQATAAPSEGTPTGNVYDKYGTDNPLARALVARFRARLDAMREQLAPASQLDCGCGEGVLAQAWALGQPECRMAACDLEDPALAEEWAHRAAPNLEYRPADVARLPFGDGEFELVSAIEVLEHVPDPDAALREMTRVTQRYLLLSVPREPLWRALNLVRGSYVREWGNTPGHINHWSRASFVRLLARHGRVLRVEAPLPWTIALLDTRADARGGR